MPAEERLNTNLFTLTSQSHIGVSTSENLGGPAVEAPKAQSTRRRRRRGGGIWGGVSPPQPTRGSGGAS